MKIVFLDSAIINPGDISWDGIGRLGEFVHYERTAQEEICPRLNGAGAAFIDSVVLDRETMKHCPDLKFIGIAATGFNHVDLEAASELGIAVANVPAYAADAVAQHAMALLLSLTNHVDAYHHAICEGAWGKSCDGTFIKAPLLLLAGKSIGIIGYGNIGKRIARMAEAFGMVVHIYSEDREAAIKSDVVSLSCPLTKENRHMIDRSFLSQMKDGAILINTARGGLVDEDALAEALLCGKLTGAGLDVLSEEPPRADHPLINLKNCLITPHIAFTPMETRRIVIETCEANLRSFLEGGRLNRLV